MCMKNDAVCALVLFINNIKKMVGKVSNGLLMGGKWKEISF